MVFITCLCLEESERNSKNMKILTIVIPSYNSEQFIEKNMKTFIDERLSEKVEILLINDGSKDNTAQKALEYQKKYPGYIRLINKENGGHGSVINRGIIEAAGRYFKVVDADDWVETNNLVRLVQILEKSQEDLILNPYIKIDQQTRKTQGCGSEQKFDKNETIDFQDIKKNFLFITLHSITYKTEILREHKIKLTENCFYEDFEYDFYPIPYIRTCKILDFPVYWYLVGQKTQSVNAISGLKNIEMYIRVLNDSIDYYNYIVEYADVVTKSYMEKFLCNYIRSMYNIFLRNGKVNNILQKMLKADKELKNKSIYFYKLVEEQNMYIRLLRTQNNFVFKIISIAFRLYKRKEVN